MPLRIEANEEPIPGYRLIERLGSGGFGEVWKAEAPGGLFKAIKFVQREAASDEAIGQEVDRSRADQEWKSLVRVKTVRHPFILLLDRFENIQNFLVIVMELADRTLADRFKECRSQGYPGIPREELLGYLAEAAEVLDLMSSQYQLQHLDIKPQNLFLVHNHIKVADFGLVKDTTHGAKLMTITGGVTPVYAAPETFDGKFSRQSDLYSLAIVYQEMLTGHRPFTGTSMKQLILQHMQNSYDLTPMPVHDRPVMAKALVRNPEDRFATCDEFVKQLRKATLARTEPENNAEARPLPLPSERAFPSISKTQRTRGDAGPLKPADPNFSVKGYLGGDAKGKAASPAPPVSTPSEQVIRSTNTSLLGQNRKAKAPRPSAHELPGTVQPALLIGLGQLGVETLGQLRQRLATEIGPPEALANLRFLAIDTDPETLHQAANGDADRVLRTQETYLTRLQRPSHYLKGRDGKLPTDNWLNPKLLYRIPRDQTNASLRALGRLAFVDNYRNIAKRIEAELRSCCSQDTPYDSTPTCDLGLRSLRPRVYIATCLAGNTGSGMFLDAAYLVRKLLNEQGHPDAEIVGIFYLPIARREKTLVPALGNTYAALTELQYYSMPTTIFSASYETAGAKAERVAQTGPAFQRCLLVPLPEVHGRITTNDNAPAVARIGDYLYRDLATVFGQALDEQRLVKYRNSGADLTAGPLMQSIGLYRIRWPRFNLLEQSARRLCSQLVTRWMSKDAKPLAVTIQQWTLERWESLGLRSEHLIERFQQLAEHALRQKPEQMLADLLGPLQQSFGGAASEALNINMGPVVQAMDGLERVLGIPDEQRSAKQAHVEPSLVERTLAEIAHVIADECEQNLAELAVTLLEDPNYRLAGAEEALRQFCATVEQALQAQEALAKELAEKASQLYERIQQLIDAPLQTTGPTSTKWLKIARRPAPGANKLRAGDLLELVRTYTKTRYHNLVLAHLNDLYVGLRGHLSDQIREVGFCRQRLGELRGLLEPTALNAKKETPPAGIRTMLPPGCLELNDALDQISKGITGDDLLCFDERVQVWIRTHCQALLQICMGSATLVRNLAPAMLLEARAFLDERLQEHSVADMYLTRQRGESEENANEAIIDDLQSCLDEATPEIGRISESREITLVSLPNDAPGLELQKLLKKRLPEAAFLLTERRDEMLFYHEIINIHWKDMDQLGPIALDAYQQRCQNDPSSPHSREDVFEWQLIVESKK